MVSSKVSKVSTFGGTGTQQRLFFGGKDDDVAKETIDLASSVEFCAKKDFVKNEALPARLADGQ